MAFDLPDLPYGYEALEPYMSSQTLHLHHDKHHLAYVNKLNELVKGTPFETATLEEIVRGSAGKPEYQGIFNNAGQHWNHTLFWRWMRPQGAGGIPGEVDRRLHDSFGSLESFKDTFVKEGVAQFGSGWVWLVEETDGRFGIMKTANGDNPLAHGRHALLGCDVWEHSYYLDYQNRRADYLKAFLDHLVDWDTVAYRLTHRP